MRRFYRKLISIILLLILSSLFTFEELNERTLPYNRVKYLKEYKKELCIYLPAQELEATGPLSSILVQYGLNVKEFAEKFNEASNMYPNGLKIPVSVFYTMKEKRYDFCFRPLQLKNLLENYVEFDELRFIYKIHVVDLYKVFLLKTEILNEKNLLKFKCNLFGTLRSFDYPFIIFFDEIDEEEDNYYQKIFSVKQINQLNTYYVDDEEDESDLDPESEAEIGEAEIGEQETIEENGENN